MSASLRTSLVGHPPRTPSIHNSPLGFT
jgi:hypothetical protein